YADVTFGARWSHLNGAIDFKGPIAPDVDRTRGWVDPVAGIVLRTPDSHRWHATLIADAGGFSTGSHFTWQAFPSVGGDLRRRVSIEVGYRWLETKYGTGDDAERFEWNVKTQGAVAGVTIKL